MSKYNSLLSTRKLFNSEACSLTKHWCHTHQNDKLMFHIQLRENPWASGTGSARYELYALYTWHYKAVRSSPQSNLIVTGIKRLGRAAGQRVWERWLPHTLSHSLRYTEDWMDRSLFGEGWGAGGPASSQDHRQVQDVWRTCHGPLQHHTR